MSDESGDFPILERLDHMALSAPEIERVLQEIRPVLAQSRIQKIYQPADRALLFELRVTGETHRLLISCEPQTARLHLVSRPLSNPPAPPSFCQFLRAHLQGARLDDISRLGDDRIVILSLSTRKGTRTLVGELTGHKANLLLLDERGHVLRDLNRQAELVDRPYEAPSPRSGPAQQKSSRFGGQTTAARFRVSQAIEAEYQDQEDRLAMERTGQARLRALRKSVAKTLRRIDAWRHDLTKAAAYRDYARYGELLKANLPAVTAGMDGVTLVDYYDPSLPDVTLPLDPTKSALHNMKEYFKKHRKHLAAERELPPRIAGAEQEVDALRQEIRSIENGSWSTTMPGGQAFSSEGATVTLRRSAQRRKGPFRRFMSVDGFPIFVGRNAQENEELTFHLAKSDDLWLHVRGTPGSHVIVRLRKGTDPPPETLRDAATLALLYSDLKKSGKGEVIYTRRKWVKAAKKQAPGAVLVTHEQSIHIHLDRKRLDNLKARNESGPTQDLGFR
ncbi:MAG TPA: NFACT family protein [Nitrospira sp.]|jgi:predicted ribosome quality control (RQC) complex YloA/Tae2 family protein